ncbi:DNA-directed RNA polymerase subunit alpha [Candidatus Parcubacteria bacterium]|nr:DNA-directed RNA polymerase subunit alpha [Candidatus Parcubacteria bacterium]
MQKITLPEKPKIIKQEGNFAIFEIKSCYPGYGMTIGNAFRRVLLSSLSGSAITAVNISGVNHEFSTIPGIAEDVVEIVLNLKKVRFKMHTDEPVKLTLKTSKEGEVRASDIITTSDVEVVDKDAYIATVNDKNSKLEMEIRVEKGTGYVPIEQQNKEKLETGNIAIDSIFTPVKKVNFRVENMRVGKLTNYDKLILEIETSGEITPEEAFKKAARLLVDHFNLFREVIEENTEDKERDEKEKEKEKIIKKEELAKEKKIESEENEKEKQEDVLKKQVEDLGLSSRILSILGDGKIKSVSKLVKKSEEDLKVLPGMGDKGIKEIKKALGKLGLTLKI